jgi:hypothetical protein
MIREDRELLTELARLNRDMAPLALRMMEGSASAAEQQYYARRLTDAGERLRRRAEEMSRVVVAGEVLVEESLVLPANTIEPYWHREQRS